MLRSERISVVIQDTGQILKWVRTLDEAEAYVDRLGKVDPEGLVAGKYSIDVPEEVQCLQKNT